MSLCDNRACKGLGHVETSLTKTYVIALSVAFRVKANIAVDVSYVEVAANHLNQWVCN